jgi:transcriptional regulator with XRE-family HTH domain
MTTFGCYLREQRRAKFGSQHALARAIGKSRQAIAAWEADTSGITSDSFLLLDAVLSWDPTKAARLAVGLPAE